MKTSTREDICREVRLSMHRFNCSPQRWDQLRSRLASEDQSVVADTLLSCLQGLPEDAYRRQAYLHGLLLALQPRPTAALPDVLGRLLPTWNRDAADLPLYLSRAFGAEQLCSVLNDLDRVTGDQTRREKIRRMRCAIGQRALP